MGDGLDASDNWAESAGRIDVERWRGGRLPESTRVVQFTGALSDRQHKKLARWFSTHPGATLRAYGNYRGGITDLEFLRFYPDLVSFEVDTMHGGTPDVRGLRHLSSGVRHLGLGIPTGEEGEETLARLGSLTSLALQSHTHLPESLGGLASLTELYIEGPTRNLETLRELTNLEQLTLRSVTVPNLEPLVGLTKLRSLAIKLGGTRDLAAIGDLKALTYLELWMIRGLTDVSFLSRLASLEALHLQSLRRVTELPSFAPLTHLTKVWLENMRGLTDVSPVAEAPHIERLALIDFAHLQAEVVTPFAGHPTLRDAALGFGSDRKNTRARQIVGLPDFDLW